MFSDFKDMIPAMGNTSSSTSTNGSTQNNYLLINDAYSNIAFILTFEIKLFLIEFEKNTTAMILNGINVFISTDEILRTKPWYR